MPAICHVFCMYYFQFLQRRKFWYLNFSKCQLVRHKIIFSLSLTRSCMSLGNLLGAEKQGSCSISEQSPVFEGWKGALEGGFWELSPLYRGCSALCRAPNPRTPRPRWSGLVEGVHPRWDWKNFNISCHPNYSVIPWPPSFLSLLLPNLAFMDAWSKTLDDSPGWPSSSFLLEFSRNCRQDEELPLELSLALCKAPAPRSILLLEHRWEISWSCVPCAKCCYCVP